MKWLHNLLKGVSLSGALFVFQACYGTPQTPLYDEMGEAPMRFTLVSAKTGEPIEGILIQSVPTSGYQEFQEVGTTGTDGKCAVSLLYYRNLDGPLVRFSDTEGRYEVKDTSFTDLREREILIRLKEVQ